MRNVNVIVRSRSLQPLTIEQERQLRRSLKATYRLVAARARSIVLTSRPHVPGLSTLFRRGLADPAPSDYAFLFRQVYTLSGKPFAQGLNIGAAVHVLQMSTFVLDDIIDESDQRHDMPTINKSFGKGAALIAGNLMQNIAMVCIERATSQERRQRRDRIVRLSHTIVDEVYRGQHLDLRQREMSHESLGIEGGVPSWENPR